MSDTIFRLAVNDEGEPEIFHSIQGEGLSLGAPRVFIRLSGCNLHCKWCDTAYTWNWEGTPFLHETGQKFQPETEMVKCSLTELVTEVSHYEPSGIVITGGEPLLQKANLPVLIDGIRGAAGPVWVEIETNGSIAPQAGLIERVNQFNISPKLTHSGNDASVAIREHVLSLYAGLPTAWFKFVIAKPGDVEVVTELASVYKIPHSRIFLMPLGVTSAEIRERSKWLSDICVSKGFRFSDRLHIHLYGDTRGT